MDQNQPRPRVSRETRLLLVTALVAVIALWVLARVRFPDQPAAPNPVQPLLTQLASRPRFDDLAAEISQLQPRIEPLLVGPSLRVRSDAAVALLDDARPTAIGPRDQLVGFDPASHLAVLRAPFLPVPPPVPWHPSDLRQPRYLIAADTSAGTLALRPVFVGSLVPTPSPLWPDVIWALPDASGLSPGMFVFTSDALLAGLVIDHGSRSAILPGAVLLAEADRLLVPTVTSPGYLGVHVQPLTTSIARATGAATGVVVTAVDPDGPASEVLAAGDVLEAVDGEALPTPLHWEARAARVATGKTITIRVRRGGEARDAVLTAAPPPTPPATGVLGLTLRSIPGTGSAITRVTPGSVAERAGLAAGDVITLIGASEAPSPAAVRRTFDAASGGGAVLVAFARGDTHAVTALDK